VGGGSSLAASISTPHPNPPPQGGREFCPLALRDDRPHRAVAAVEAAMEAVGPQSAGRPQTGPRTADHLDRGLAGPCRIESDSRLTTTQDGFGSPKLNAARIAAGRIGLLAKPGPATWTSPDEKSCRDSQENGGEESEVQVVLGNAKDFFEVDDRLVVQNHHDEHREDRNQDDKPKRLADAQGIKRWIRRSGHWWISRCRRSSRAVTAIVLVPPRLPTKTPPTIQNQVRRPRSVWPKSRTVRIPSPAQLVIVHDLRHPRRAASWTAKQADAGQATCPMSLPRLVLRVRLTAKLRAVCEPQDTSALRRRAEAGCLPMKERE
jgi:hypothetical protein